MLAGQLGAKLMVKIRLAAFRAVRGPRPGFLNRFSKERRREAISKAVALLGRPMFPGTPASTAVSLLPLLGFRDFRVQFIICVCCAFSPLGH